MIPKQNPDLLCAWRESAKSWTQHSSIIQQMFAPVTRALIEHAGIVEGQSVLDVAGGAGEPSLTIADQVRSSGSVTCTDAVALMVETAQAAARDRGLSNIRFSQCTAESLPFPDNSFDAVVCRLGVMLFPNPDIAVREMLRVTKTGGAIGLVVWHKSELNPFCYTVTDVMAGHVDSPATDGNAPGAFRFAELGKLARVVKDAGAFAVHERVVQFEIVAPISPEQFWAMRSTMSDTLRDKLASLSDEEKTQIANEVKGAVRSFFPQNEMRFPAKMILVTGKKAR